MEKTTEKTYEQIQDLLAKLDNKLDVQTARVDALVSKVDSNLTEKRPMRDLFKSKKAIATMVGLLVPISQKLGLEIPPDTLTAIVGLIAAYVVGQGVADHGKEREKVRSRYQASQKPGGDRQYSP